jgi:signal transduction histidine kinase/ActR/RegA family two-component response regulator
LILAVSPRKRLDGEYQSFFSLVAGQVTTALAEARAWEGERQRAEALAELDRAKTQFFSNVSHEFRTPLTLMLGPLEEILAIQGAVSPAVRELAAVTHRNGLRLQKLVNTLLDFSRLEAGRVQAYYRPFDLAMLTADLASTFRSAMEKAGLRFIIDCAPLAEPVYVDREMWEKVVLNLLSNAFKYTFEGVVTVRLQGREGRAVLAVEDTGTGIPEQELPHLFERFHRVEGARGRTQAGTGIGLALVAELVKLHGGTVEVRSTLGQGSTFTVFLPFGAAHLPAERVNSALNLPSTALRRGSYVEEATRWLPDSENIGLSVEAEDLSESVSAGLALQGKVLLADDNADMREYMHRLLSVHYKVEAAANGVEALARAVADPPDLVLTDVMMPELDGFGFLQALRSDPRTRTVPVILLSARAGEEARSEGMDAGADDYLTKPFSARELLARVGAHLKLARARQEAEEQEGVKRIV